MKKNQVLDVNGNGDEQEHEWRDILNGWLKVPTLETLQTLIAEKVTHTNRSRLQESFFKIYIRETTIPLIQIALIVLAALILFTWPTDYYYFANHPEIIDAYFWFRTISILGISVFVPLMHYWDFMRENVFPVVYLGVLAVIALTGYLFGNVAHLDLRTPWFYAIFVLPILTVFLSVKIYPRIVATFAVPIVYAGAYLYDNFGDQYQYYWGYEYRGLILNITLSIVIISILLGHIVYHLNRSNFFQARELKDQRQRIQILADHDQLTGLYTRREFENRYRNEFDRCERYDSNLSVMMIDLDHFKEINDTYGHPIGDDVLETMGSLIQEQTRASDIAGRYGGEEFCLVLPETPEDGALKMAERLRESLANQTFNAPEGETFTVTCSIGIAEYESSINDPEELLGNADQALYEAKEGGRNQVIIA